MHNFKKMVIGIFISMVAFGALSQANPAYCPEHLKFGSPSGPNATNIQVCRRGYALLFNTVTKTPLWVQEHLKEENVFGAAARMTQFSTDPAIPAQYQASKADYRGTGFDQGHMAPAADFSQDQALMNESFYFSNAVPQEADNNRHIWANLEKKVRGWLGSRHDLYVITGPIFYNQQVSQTLKPSGVAVPDALYKIIYDPRTEGAIAFMMPNEPIDVSDLPKYIVSIREVEKATGLNFHPTLARDVQERIKTRKPGMWTR